MENIRKSLSLLLVFAILICIVPFDVLALNEIGSANAALLQVEDALFDYIDRSEFNRAAYSSRLKHKETASSFVFKSADGTETVYYLADNGYYAVTPWSHSFDSSASYTYYARGRDFATEQELEEWLRSIMQ